MSDHQRILDQVEDKIKNLDGFYEIKIIEQDVMLTVHPPQGNGIKVTEATVLGDLQSREITDVDQAILLTVIREAIGEPVKIGTYVVGAEEANIQVLVARDRMEATLCIQSTKKSRPATKDDLLNKLEQSGVSYGIDEVALFHALDNPGVAVSVAKGLPPVDGVNSSIHFFIDLEHKGIPTQLEDGSVDFKNLHLFTTVRQGEILAEKIPFTLGVAGTDVLNQPVYAKPGKDVILPLGKNVYSENNQIFAAIDGQVVYANKKLNVIPIIEINGDVDLSTGNIDFIGNVIVHGSVQMGFTVKAKGDVEINGTLSGGTVEGKNIFVRMGIQGMNRGSIKAVENVTAKFIENATIYAGQDVLVNDVILHSRISAGKKVIVEGKKGLIAGGTVSAGEEIRCKILGSHMAVTTDLEVGVNPMLREEYQHLRRELKKVQQSLDQTQKALKILRAMNPDQISNDKREMLLKLTKAQFHLIGQQETMRNRITEIDLLFEEMRYGRIRVADVAYSGTKIVIGTLVKPIRENMKFVTFYADEGEIKTGPFK